MVISYTQTIYPDIWDIFVLVGAVSSVFLIVIVVSRLVPFIGIWEIQQFNLLAKPS